MSIQYDTRVMWDRIDALREEQQIMREKLHALSNHAQSVGLKVDALSELPGEVTGLRVEMAALKGRIAVVGLLLALVVPAITATVLGFLLSGRN